jgi:TolB-like protein/class 3 adenylate cyclase
MIEEGDVRGRLLAIRDHASVSRLAAVLFADAAEYAAAMDKDEIGTVAAMRAAMDTFSTRSRDHNGRTINFMGDGAIAAFDSAADAVQFALAFQEIIAARGLSFGGRSFGFRIGITIGEIFDEDGRPQGHSVNLAQRIQALAPVGGILVSDLVYQAVRMRSEFGFECMGAKIVKNIAEPIEVYQVHGRDVVALLKPSPRPSGEYWRTKARGANAEDFDRPSIAILPFRNLSGDTDQDFLGDGTADDIITNLTRFRGIDVIASGSTFAFRDESVQVAEIGKRLHARYVAHGTIRRSLNRVRVTVQLEDAVGGRIVWGERYDRAIEDLFEIQDEIAQLAVGAMAVTIEKLEEARVRASPPQNLDAYGLVLRGQHHIGKYTANENVNARICYLNALRRDSSYGRAHAGISRTHSHEWRHSWSLDPDSSLQAAAASAIDAIEFDPNDARGHAELGYVRLYSKEHDQAIACYRRALELNPNDANVLSEFADALTHAGQPEEGLAYFTRALRLNPFYPDVYVWGMAGAYFKLHAYDEAISCILRMHNVAQGRRLLAASYAHLGRITEARHIGDLIRADDPNFSAKHWARDIVPDRLAEHREQLFDGLKIAGL